MSEASIVHVWSTPEDDLLGFDERTCDEPDQGEEVVFHVDPRSVGGHHVCMSCGKVYWKKGQEQDDLRGISAV